MEISVVITNWNGLELLKVTLPTVLEAAIQDSENYYEILLVDDCGTDESVSYVHKNFPDVKVVQTEQNSGYMYANNFGVEQAKFPLVFCMNNDMKLAPDTISKLAKHFEDSSVFAASGAIYDWNNQFLYGNRGGFFKRGHFSYYEKAPDDTETQTLFACGGAFLCRKKVYLEMGGYDAEFYHPYYYDETDLCFRALKKGLKIVYEPASTAYHKVSQTAKRQYSVSKIKVISARNNYLFSIKNIHDPDMTREMWIFIPLFLLRDLFLLKFRFWFAFFGVLKRIGMVNKRRLAEKMKGGKSAREIFQSVKG